MLLTPDAGTILALEITKKDVKIRSTFFEIIWTVCILPVQLERTAWDLRCSSVGRLNAIKPTVPRLVPTHRDGHCIPPVKKIKKIK